MALPTFFVIGAAKSGTTSLHTYLDQHPEIQMSQIKEPHFFSGPENGIPYPSHRVADLAEYERLFDPGTAVRGESSPSYTVHPRRQGVPSRIKTLVPDARFIYLVRDPVERTVSHYMHCVAVEGERRSLSEALGDLADPLCLYTAPSRYAMQLDLYLPHFDEDRFLIIDQAELLVDRTGTLRSVFEFLGVDEHFESERFREELGATSDRRRYSTWWPQLREVLARSPLRVLPRGVRRKARRLAEQTLWPALEAPTLDDDLRARLKDLYAGDAARLRAMSGKAFPTWSV